MQVWRKKKKEKRRSGKKNRIFCVSKFQKLK